MVRMKKTKLLWIVPPLALAAWVAQLTHGFVPGQSTQRARAALAGATEVRVQYGRFRDFDESPVPVLKLRGAQAQAFVSLLRLDARPPRNRPPFGIDTPDIFFCNVYSHERKIGMVEYHPRVYQVPWVRVHAGSKSTGGYLYAGAANGLDEMLKPAMPPR